MELVCGSQAELLKEADADVARRALPGAWALIGMVQFLLVASNYFRDHRVITSVFALVNLGACILRLFVIIGKTAIYDANPRRWSIVFAASLFTVAADWGILASYAVAVYGFGNWNLLLMIICVLGMSAGSVATLAPRYFFLLCHVVPLLLPPILGYLHKGGQQGYAMAIITSVYAAFLLSRENT